RSVCTRRHRGRGGRPRRPPPALRWECRDHASQRAASWVSSPPKKRCAHIVHLCIPSTVPIAGWSAATGSGNDRCGGRMNESPTELYEALARGEGHLPDDPRVVGALRQKVADAQRDPDIAARREALAVCRAMKERDGLDWMLNFAGDPDV